MHLAEIFKRTDDAIGSISVGSAVTTGAAGTWLTLTHINTIIGTASGLLTIAILVKQAQKEYLAKNLKQK